MVGTGSGSELYKRTVTMSEKVQIHNNRYRPQVSYIYKKKY